MLSRKLNIAHLPTPIHKLENLSEQLGKDIYIKRDDYTGTEVSGNKIRKLEYTIQYALDQGFDCVITTGAITSNHARATAAVCAKYQIPCHLVLRGEYDGFEGNLFLDRILGAAVHLIGPDESRESAMEAVAEDLKAQQHNPLLIPVGASDWIGTHGYIDAYHEIVTQQQQLGINFDSIHVAVGSGGSYAGLWYGAHTEQHATQVIGYAVDQSTQAFERKVQDIILGLDDTVKDFDTLRIVDDYIGEGYGIATDEELQFYIDIAQLEGIVLDPTYTGKAFRGLVNEIKKGHYEHHDRILFVHTGGLQGYTQVIRDRIEGLLDQRKNDR